MIRALYVDDEPDLLLLGKLFLEHSGEIQVDTAESPLEVLEKLKTTKYDSIISDYQMPEMSGIELLKHVRKHIGKIPFIIFTGRGREEVVIEALNCGADFYLQKGGDAKSQFAELEYKIKLVDERNKMRDAITQSKLWMTQIINHLPDATLVINAGGIVIAWNRAIEDLTGIPAANMIGRGNYEYALPFYGERRPILINIALTGTRDRENDYPDIRCKGDVLESEIPLTDAIKTGNPGIRDCCLLSRASPLYDTENVVIGAIESIRVFPKVK
ncbi:MAG: response regulator [Methanoregulaceae archaeon]